MSKKKTKEIKEEQTAIETPAEKPTEETGTDVVYQSPAVEEQGPAIQNDIVEEGPQETVGEDKYAAILKELDKTIEEANKLKNLFPSLEADHLYVELQKLKKYIATAP